MQHTRGVGPMSWVVKRRSKGLKGHGVVPQPNTGNQRISTIGLLMSERDKPQEIRETRQRQAGATEATGASARVKDISRTVHVLKAYHGGISG